MLNRKKKKICFHFLTHTLTSISGHQEGQAEPARGAPDAKLQVPTCENGMFIRVLWCAFSSTSRILVLACIRFWNFLLRVIRKKELRKVKLEARNCSPNAFCFIYFCSSFHLFTYLFFSQERWGQVGKGGENVTESRSFLTEGEKLLNFSQGDTNRRQAGHQTHHQRDTAEMPGVYPKQGPTRLIYILLSPFLYCLLRGNTKITSKLRPATIFLIPFLCKTLSSSSFGSLWRRLSRNINFAVR